MSAHKAERDCKLLWRARACPNCHSMRRGICSTTGALTLDNRIPDFSAWEFAIECLTYEWVDSDAATVAEAVANWNATPRRSLFPPT